MPSSYRAFYVPTFTIEPGKVSEAVDWFTEAVSIWSRLPGVKNVQAYVTQFSLGAPPSVEVWCEIENYAALDQWDELTGDIQREFLEHSQAAAGVVRTEPARLVGDLVGSVPADLGGTLGA